MNAKLLSIALVLGGLVLAQQSRADFVANGSFESNGGNGQMGFNTTVTDWSVPALNNSYTFVFGPGTGDTIGSAGEYGTVHLWGPNNGSANGLPASSPDGGFYLANDGDFQNGAISQTLSGLTSGDSYTVSFYWAAAQQSGFFGPSTEQFQVGFGSETQNTPILSIPSQGFSGWTPESFTFTADGSTDLLSFFAAGTPLGVPTFALLDGVSVTSSSAPLPSALSLSFVLMIGVAAFRAYRAKAVTA